MTADGGFDARISIHALREEGDRCDDEPHGLQLYFYPRPPRGGRHGDARNGNPACRFLSTPSARRATAAVIPVDANRLISIHALREEGDLLRFFVSLRFWISIHALREEGDRRSAAQRPRRSISIHALREEGDHPTITDKSPPAHFYPRPPRGGRPSTMQPVSSTANFYPRPPRGGRPHPVSVRFAMGKFLSTPSARRATQEPLKGGEPHGYFYPRPPRGGRHPQRGTHLVWVRFLSTPSARRATWRREALCRGRLSISIHALREEGDLAARG